MDRGTWRATVHGVPKSDMTELTNTFTFMHVPNTGGLVFIKLPSVEIFVRKKLRDFKIYDLSLIF